MTGNRLPVVLTKLAAVIIVVLSLDGLASFVSYTSSADLSTSSKAFSLALSFGVPVLIAAWLWFFPATTLGAEHAVQTDIQSDVMPDERFVTVGVTLIGLYTLVFGVIDLSYYESLRIAERDYLEADGLGIYEPAPDLVAARYTNLLQTGLGIVLLLGRRGLGKALAHARGRGTGDA